MSTDSTSVKAETRRGQEWKVIAVLIIMIVGLEGIFRVAESHLSEDIRHLRALPRLAERIEARDSQAETTLIVGNSLARRGVDAVKLKEGLERRAGAAVPVHVEFFVPDASSVTEWSWGLRRYFNGEEIALKRIVVITGINHLHDQLSNPEKLGAFFVARSDLVAAMPSMEGREEAIRLLLGHFSRVIANRDRVRPLIGYRFFPGFEEAWPRLAVVGFEATLDRLGESAGLGKLKSLQRLADRVAGLDAELLVVAVPLPGGYELPANILNFLTERNVTVMDMSTVSGIDENDFPDGYHLDSGGAEKFTEALLESLP